ncbi:hypothetical protein Avbf_17641, partial [Armadillidium vulgare]
MFIHNLLLEFIIGIILLEILSFTESKSCKKGVGHRYSVSDRLSYDEAIKNCNKDGQEGNNWIREMVSKVKNFDTVVNSENWIDFCFGIPADYPDKISIYFCPAKFYAAC